MILISNALFNLGRNGFLDGSFNWLSSNIKVALVRGYTFTSTNEFVQDVENAGGTLHARSGNLTSKAATNGVASAANVTFTAPAANSSNHSLLIYYDAGSDTTSRVIAWIDTGTGLPVQPNGADISVAWDTGPNAIFAL